MVRVQQKWCGSGIADSYQLSAATNLPRRERVSYALSKTRGIVRPFHRNDKSDGTEHDSTDESQWVHMCQPVLV